MHDNTAPPESLDPTDDSAITDIKIDPVREDIPGNFNEMEDYNANSPTQLIKKEAHITYELPLIFINDMPEQG